MMEQLYQAMTGPLDDYRPIPFWSWNHALDPQTLVCQIRQMKADGIGGFIMHARTGLTEEYLGEHWMACIDICLQEARRLGMQAWIYDENGWPSGFVGGKLLENEAFRARFLEYAVGAFDPAAYAVFVREDGGYRRVEAPVGAGEYHNIYLRISPANTDILNPAVVDAFLAETHEAYYRRFADSFGRELAGFFTDEPQFYRWATPYTPCAEAYFDDIRDGLVWLFDADPQGYPFRLRYYGVLNDLYTRNFYQKVQDWCHAHGCQLTGHSVEEPHLHTQMWGGGAVMPSYAYEDIPGIDCLCRANMEELSPCQVSSVAAQLGKQRILTETFACSGYDVTPRELRSIAESQFFHGVNLLCHHLYPYSIAGQGKVDHPPVFGPQSNWGDGFRDFNDYFARLGCLMANTQAQVDVAILSPQHDVWLRYIRTLDRDSVAALEDSFHGLLTGALRRAGITYHLIDETILARHGSAAGSTLRVGQMCYDTVLIPQMENLAQTTCDILRGYTGRLCMLSTPAYIDGHPAQVPLTANLTLDELLRGHVPFSCPDGNSFLTHRTGAWGDFLFIKNLSFASESRVQLQTAGDYRVLDLQKLTLHPAATEMTLEPGGSRILLRTQAPVQAFPTVRTDVTGRFRVADISPNYLLLDTVELSTDGSHFAPSYPIPGRMEELLRQDYCGPVTVRQRFTLQAPMRLTLLMEKADLHSAALNGQPLKFVQSDFDVNFVEADITHLAVAGENILTYRFQFWQHAGVHFALFDPLATESLRNCLYYDTSIEPVYLRGDFTVGPGHLLVPRRTLPPVTSALYREGYPFFLGTLTLAGTLPYTGGPAVLTLDGRFQTAEVTANGQTVRIVLDRQADISGILQPGENEVQIVLRSSLRNLMGPHHFAPDPEPFGVSPVTFTLRGQWESGIPDAYTHTYHSVPFGLEGLYLTQM